MRFEDIFRHSSLFHVDWGNIYHVFCEELDMGVRLLYPVLLGLICGGCKLNHRRPVSEEDDARKAMLRAAGACNQKGMDVGTAQYGAPNGKEVPCTVRVPGEVGK